jgi:branched-chain amino acid transport system permease protein
VVGNLRSFPLTIAGGLLIGALEALATPFAAIAPYRSAAPFVVAILALAFRQRAARSSERLDQAIAVRANFALPDFGRKECLAALGVVLAAAVLVPAFASSFWLRSLTSVITLALASLSVTVLYAQVGIVSLCQFALVGIGGWVSLRIGHATAMPFTLSLLTGAVVASAFGVLAGLPALRLRGIYVALVTLMIAGALQVAFTVLGFPDGGAGFLGRVSGGGQVPMARPDFASSDEAYFRYTLIIATFGFLLVQVHRKTRPGRAWALIRRGDAVAIALGVDIIGYKIWAFALAGFLAGAAGGLLGGAVGILDAGGFPAIESVMLFALSIIAGAYHWSGPIFVGLMMRGLPNLLLDVGVDGNIATALFGIGLLHSLIASPEGIAGGAIAALRALETLFARPTAKETT